VNRLWVIEYMIGISLKNKILVSASSWGRSKSFVQLVFQSVLSKDYWCQAGKHHLKFGGWGVNKRYQIVKHWPCTSYWCISHLSAVISRPTSLISLWLNQPSQSQIFQNAFILNPSNPWICPVLILHITH